MFGTCVTVTDVKVKNSATLRLLLTYNNKKSVGGRAKSSVWQLTIAERRNAALFILNTTARPFTFMGYSFRCFYCQQYHSDLNTLLKHTRTHKMTDLDEIMLKYIPKGKKTVQVDISDLRCKLCNKKSLDLKEMREHLIKLHKVEFTKASNGMSEYVLKLKNGQFFCHVCENEFHSFTLLNNHMNLHFGKVVCESCGAAFQNIHLLKKHNESHLSSRFNCNFCDKIFLKKSQMKYHTAIVHRGKQRAREQKCPHCDETFREHYRKMLHLKQIHGFAKNFKCHICASQFNMRRSLTEHVTRFHTEKYKCDVCSKCFSIESKLRAHQRGHSGERTFVCPICKNAYMHKITLSKHMLIHDTSFH